MACRFLIKKSLNETPSEKIYRWSKFSWFIIPPSNWKNRQLLIELSIWKPVQPPKKMDNLLASQLRHAEELWPLELPAVQTIFKRFSKKTMQLLISDTHTDANWAHDTKFDTWKVYMRMRCFSEPWTKSGAIMFIVVVLHRYGCKKNVHESKHGETFFWNKWIVQNIVSADWQILKPLSQEQCTLDLIKRVQNTCEIHSNYTDSNHGQWWANKFKNCMQTHVGLKNLEHTCQSA